MGEETSGRGAGQPQEKPRRCHGVKHFFAAFGYSMDGLKAAFKNESAFRQEILLQILNVALALAIRLPWQTRALLISLGFILLTTELLNSALEALTNLASPEWHPLAKRAKDMGSAAVFVMLVALGTAWAIAIFRTAGWAPGA